MSRLNTAPTGLAGWLTPRRLWRYPVLITLGLAASAVWLAWSDIRQGIPPALALGQDFKGYYTGGRFLLDGRIDELYDIAAQKDFQSALAIPGDGVLPFIHPPYSTVLWAPFAAPPYAWGLALWYAAGLVLLGGALALLRREVLPAGAGSLRRLIGLSFLYYPTLAWFVYAQNTALTLFLTTASFVLLRRRKDFAAGLVLGLSLYKPQLALAYGLMLLVKWRWKALLGLAVCAGLWLALGFAMSPQAMADYARLGPQLLPAQLSLDEPGLKPWAVHTLTAFANLLLGGLWPAGAAGLGYALMLAGAAWLALTWRAQPWLANAAAGTASWDLTFALTTVAAVLISPYAYFYDLMLLLLPLGIAWGCFPRGTGGRPLDGGRLFVWSAGLWGAALAGNFLAALQLRLASAAGLPPLALQISVPILAGWAWQARRLAREGAAAAPPAGQFDIQDHGA